MTVRRILQLVSLTIVFGAAALWVFAGANRGWTRTNEPRKTLDEVTGIEGITYEKRFVPGLDFLGGALLGGGILAGASLLFRKPPTPDRPT
jgi:hypothetical protein